MLRGMIKKINDWWKTWINELYRRNRILTKTGLIHFVLFICFVGLMLIDSRTLLGLNVWIKPMKFAVSIGIYSLTLAFIMKYVKNVKVQKFVSYGTVMAMYVEMVIIATQAARGTKSHFNYETVLDASLYSIMGIMIGFAMICSIVLAVYLFRTKLDLPDHLVFALRFGLLIFILGGVIGGYMSSGTQHTVGTKEGGSGLPVVNWSDNAGDLRVPHFFGLHALQLIPLIAYFTTLRIERMKIKLWVTWFIVLMYVLVVSALFLQASLGIPFITM